jgi:hypothetical protein
MSSAAQASLLAERDEAIRVLRAGARAVHVVEPAAAREPIRLLLTATADLCATDWHILGKPVTYPLALARALLDAGGKQ